ncbi:hypothetical protein SUGI_1181240 [Cryptomeria japonica]|nr:hypothetical protein SUGI_1181240 [Cryptomeria japonica]
MQIAYHAKYPELVCVVLLLCIVCNGDDFCGSNNTSTEFENNFNIVLKNLVKNTSSSNGFNTSSYGQSPDTVYGLLQCLGDATEEEGLSCSQEANTTIRDVCKNATGGRFLLAKCFIRYEKYSFFGILDTNSRVVYITSKVPDDADVFRTAVTGLFSNLSENALQSSRRYSSALAMQGKICTPDPRARPPSVRMQSEFQQNSYSPSAFICLKAPDHTLQCWRDLTSVEDCGTCLRQAIRKLLDVTFTDEGTFQGGVSLMGSCFARYETYSFFHPAPPPPPSPIKVLSPPPSSLPTATKSSNKVGIVLGIVAGSLVMLLLCLFAIRRKFKFAFFWKHAVLRKENLDSEVDSEIGHKQEINFNLENIKAATSDFHEDNKLGEGGFGSVYKGTMPNGLQIAVKRLSVQSSQGKKQFLNEIKLVAKIQHRNLVNLLRCCAEGSERLLVYEFLPNKSLDKILFHPERSQELDWPKRLNIILGVARGLLYLHQDSQLQIIHRDIKASNILLDEKMQPKISDFGLARLFQLDETHVNTMVAGTLGYMAPEYAVGGQLSVKADVYSFGVLILEIMCGRKNSDSRLPLEYQSLLEWVR